MKFQVTRQQVIKAIKNEPLKSGSWVHYEDQLSYDELGEQIITPNPKFKNNTGCAVCAVGGILDRSIGGKVGPIELSRIGSDIVRSATMETLTERMQDEGILQDWITDGRDVSVRTLVNIAAKNTKGHPLSALSALFEALMDREGMTTAGGLANYRARRILVKFVKNHFPTKLTLDTNKSY